MLYVYLDTNVNRLVTSSSEIKTKGYEFLMSTDGGSDYSNTFCLGYIMGTIFGKKPINDVNEFK